MSTNIQWTDEVWNPTTGCTRDSSGCDNCYAVTMTKRLEAMGQEKYSGLVNIGKNHFNGVLKCHEDVLLKPLSWRKPKRIFVNSMSDLFHKEVPFEFIDKVFAVMALCPQHTFQVLTKRPERMAEYFHTYNGGPAFSEDQEQQLAHYFPAVMVEDLCNGGESTTMRQLPGWWGRLNKVKDFVIAAPPNVWLGTSCENQETADERIPHLLRCPAAVRFLSCEPLLAEISLFTALWETEGVFNPVPLNGIHWVITGGESGPNARHCTIGHIRSLVKQCKAAGVPVFVKQLGSRPVNREGVPHPVSDSHGGNWDEWPEDLRVREFPNEGMAR